MSLYDSDRWEALHLMHINVSGTCLGTVASDAAGTELFSVPAGSYIEVMNVRSKVTGGGTGAATAPSFGIGYSLAGTGAATAIATSVWGTRADNAYVSHTVSSVKLVPGDVVSLHYVAGTVAETNQIYTVQAIEYKEYYPGG